MNYVLDKILRSNRAIIFLMCAVIILGTYSYINIPREGDPDIQIPVFTVSVMHHGISTEDSLSLLVKPLEPHLRGLEGLKHITSIAVQGYAVIILEFDIAIDSEQAELDVREKVDQAKSNLPSGSEEPIVSEINLGLYPVISVNISGDLPERTLYNFAKDLSDEIEELQSVLEVQLKGNREEVLEVIIDDTFLESYNITPDELVQAVLLNNQLVAAGKLDTGTGSFNIKVPGLFENKKDVLSLPIKVSDNGVVTLGDVANVRRTFKDATGFSNINGKKAFTLDVVKRIGGNIVETTRLVRQVVKDNTENWPDNVEVSVSFDMSDFIFEVLSSLESAIMTAISLVMIVIVASLGLRSAILIGISIPTSFVASFFVLNALGLTLNMMIMFGLVLTVGILVDSGVIIVEYADRKMSEGLERVEAYIAAAKRMFLPVFSSTATTLAAFFPMLFWPGVSGEFMGFLPKTVIIVLLCSFITSMIFMPVLGGLIGKANVMDKKAALVLSGDVHADFSTIKGFVGLYIKVLQKLIDNPLKVVISILSLLVLIGYLFSQFAKGTEFFVETEPQQALIYVMARGNLSAEEKYQLANEVEKRVLEVKGIKTLQSSIGSSSSSGGFDMVMGPDSPTDLIAFMMFELVEYNKRPPGKEILAEIREKTKDMNGVFVEVTPRDQGPPTGKHLRLQLRSKDYDEVNKATAYVRNYFENELGGVRDIEDTRSLPGVEWNLYVDRQEAGRYGANLFSVGNMVQLVTEGLDIGKYRPVDSDEQIDIKLRLPEDKRNLTQLEDMRVITHNGAVPLANFVELKASPAVNSISRVDGKYSFYVKANVNDGYLINNKVAQINQWLEKQDLGKDVSYMFRGADEEQKDSEEFLQKAMLYSLFLMFIILVTQYNSVYQTFITLQTVVFSVFGVLLGMLITGQTFSIIMSGTGVVALAGIVVNNSIVLLDTYNRMRKLGDDVRDAIIRASCQRLRPILLTTITTIFGIMPMALEVNIDYFNRAINYGGITTAWWVHFSTAIIFGLAFSTILTLILNPVLIVFGSNFHVRLKTIIKWLKLKVVTMGLKKA